MQVGDLPLVFELSGVRTPPKGGGEGRKSEYYSDSSGICSRPNTSEELGGSSGIASRPNARGSGEASVGVSSKSNGRSEVGAGGASPSKPKGRLSESTIGTFSLGIIGGLIWDNSSSMPHVGHDEVPDETNPQIGHSYTVPAEGVHASRCRKGRGYSSK